MELVSIMAHPHLFIMRSCYLQCELMDTTTVEYVYYICPRCDEGVYLLPRKAAYYCECCHVRLVRDTDVEAEESEEDE